MTSNTSTASRREFLRAASMLSTVGSSAAPFALNLMAMGSAAAQSTSSDYKALICLYFVGGNDHANTVLATDTTSWSEYLKYRETKDASGNISSTSISLGAPNEYLGVLPITPTTAQQGTRSFALNPRLPKLTAMFEDGRAAVLANVGTLIQPTTRAQFKSRSVDLPASLFSHNDQQSLWQSNGGEGATTGWGGRMGDLLMANNSNAVFTAISTAGTAVFLFGNKINQYQISNSGAVSVAYTGDGLYGQATGANKLSRIIRGDHNNNNLLEKEHAAIVTRSMDAAAQVNSAMAPAGSTGVPAPPQYNGTDNPLALQLHAVARMIAGRSVLGAKRQVFYVQMTGFDTHDNQKNSHLKLMALLDSALDYFFNTALKSLPGGDMTNNVTLFTASDFGRTFKAKQSGTDHGWGAHHFIIGGAVKGKDIYGIFPETGVSHAYSATDSGSLLPSTSVDQYGATLGKWFGLSPSNLALVFPNLKNFSNRDLGFMKT